MFGTVIMNHKVMYAFNLRITFYKFQNFIFHFLVVSGAQKLIYGIENHS